MPQKLAVLDRADKKQEYQAKVLEEAKALVDERDVHCLVTLLLTNDGKVMILWDSMGVSRLEIIGMLESAKGMVAHPELGEEIPV